MLNIRKQGIVSNEKSYSLTSIEAGVPQGSILRSMLFLIYINDLSDDLTTNVKLFAGGTSLYSIVHKMNTSTIILKKDLKKSQTVQFSKQTQEVIFSRKLKKTNHIQVISITTPFNKFPLKNNLECIKKQNIIFRNT